ncbi:hypothetical protein SKAU_G00298590 [Synaphobranchus kaupii]|uniref:Uncharacterized protein n=1 Tax=Synaphobranchus kaupii TaxID=118154 RepID=A0A9Q1EV53_SYNKA|nr:hypothetical protein SKAU_G00298590 [Synaphobranchus kaupii]
MEFSDRARFSVHVGKQVGGYLGQWFPATKATSLPSPRRPRALSPRYLPDLSWNVAQGTLGHAVPDPTWDNPVPLMMSQWFLRQCCLGFMVVLAPPYDGMTGLALHIMTSQVISDGYKCAIAKGRQSEINFNFLCLQLNGRGSASACGRWALRTGKRGGGIEPGGGGRARRQREDGAGSTARGEGCRRLTERPGDEGDSQECDGRRRESADVAAERAGAAPRSRPITEIGERAPPSLTSGASERERCVGCPVLRLIALSCVGVLVAFLCAHVLC